MINFIMTYLAGFIVLFIVSFIFSYVLVPTTSIVARLLLAILITIGMGLGTKIGEENFFEYFNKRILRDRTARTNILKHRTVEMEEMRLLALTHVKPFLSPFTNIWGNLKLSNKFCVLALSKNGKSISGIEKVEDNSKTCRSFYITKSDNYSFDELWNRFCVEFGHNTTYDALVRLSKICQTDIKEGVSKNTQHQVSNNTELKSANVKKIDINNCSESEMTSLPGINIVTSKKIIKKREEIGGFQNIDDFFSYLKTKERMKEQLRNLICVNKMQGTTKIEKSQERTLDL